MLDATKASVTAARWLLPAAVLLVLPWSAVTVPAAFAEEPNAGFRSSYESELAGAFQKVERLAQAMPAETYGWRPGEGVRSVSEALMHIAAGNYLLADELGVPRPDDLPEDFQAVSVKEEVLAILRRSFEQAKTALETTCAGDLDRQVWSNGTTARGVLLRLLVHANEHLGQLIAYARVNGVVPPWSR